MFRDHLYYLFFVGDNIGVVFFNFFMSVSRPQITESGYGQIQFYFTGMK